MIGDVIGAMVEAESPGYIRKTFQNVDRVRSLWRSSRRAPDSRKMAQQTDRDHLHTRKSAANCLRALPKGTSAQFLLGIEQDKKDTEGKSNS
jgi:hypothetical protein